MRLHLLAVCGLVALLASCTKKPKDTPEPEKPTVIIDTILTEEKLIGKWEVTDVVFHYYTDGVETSWTAWTKNKGIRKNGEQGQRWNPETDVSFITFKEDHTFFHVKPDGTPNSYMLVEVLMPDGKWNLVNAKNLKLTTDFNGNGLDVDWTYRLQDKALTIEYFQKEVADQSIYGVRMEALLEKQ